MRTEFGGNLHFEHCLSGKTEYYSSYDKVDVDCGRSAIQYIIEVESKSNIYLPVYDCPLVNKRVNEAIENKGMQVHFYHMNENMQPVLPDNLSDAVVLVVNYFGLMPDEFLDKAAALHSEDVSIIIDNIPGYFEKPRMNAYNIYSCRKFIGVPDGGHIIKDGIDKSIQMETVEDSSRYLYLLKAVNTGSNSAYDDYEVSEDIFTDSTKPYGMSPLTHALLKSVDYDFIMERRRKNFAVLHELLGQHNTYPVMEGFGKKAAFAYPFLVKEGGAQIRKKLIENNIYVSTLWKHVFNGTLATDFEKHIALDLIPLPIDQRYDEEDMKAMAQIISSIL